MGKLHAYEHLPARSLAQASAMISSLSQALHFGRDRKRKVSYNFYRYCACETGTGFKSLHSSIAHIRIWSLIEPRLETLVSPCWEYLGEIRPWFFSHSAVLSSYVILLKPLTLGSQSPCLWNGNTPEMSFSTFLITQRSILKIEIVFAKHN